MHMEEPYIKEPINKAFANTDLIDIGSLNEGTTGIVQKALQNGTSICSAIILPIKQLFRLLIP